MELFNLQTLSESIKISQNLIYMSESCVEEVCTCSFVCRSGLLLLFLMGSDRKSNSSIVGQTYRQHLYDMHRISFIFFQINGGNIEIHTVQSDSINIGLFSFHFFYSMLCKSV